MYMHVQRDEWCIFNQLFWPKIISLRKIIESNVKVHVVDYKVYEPWKWLVNYGKCDDEEKGASFEEIIAFNENYKKKVKHFLSVS